MCPTIRKAQLDDADGLFAVVQPFVTSFVLDRAAFETSLAALIDDETVWLGVADDDGEVVGYCLGFVHLTFYANGRVGWIEEIAVRADRRRQGIGRALMAAFEDWAQSQGAALTALATRRAAPFYLALGYDESAAYFRKLL